MSRKLPVTAIVLTYNEEINLPDCLNSVKDYVNEIVIIDSFSNDKTIEIAQEYTSLVYQNTFINQAKQFIWGLENAAVSNEWILRIDADERWSNEGFTELKGIIEKDEVDGVYVRMKIFFMGKFLRWGGMYPNQFLRVYKRTKGRMEDRWMDEHIKVDGKICNSTIDVIESNFDRQHDLSLWTKKHNIYSTREAVEFLVGKYNLFRIDSVGSLFGNKVQRKRWFKEHLYFRVPLFTRPFLYFIYRYFFQLGFLDGRRGFIFTVLQGFWYRFLVDSKIFQIEKLAKDESISIREAIYEYSKIEV